MINKCPHCQVELNEETLGQEQQKRSFYRLSVYEGELQYDVIDEDFDDSRFYCRECDTDINMEEEEVISLLKNAKN